MSRRAMLLISALVVGVACQGLFEGPDGSSADGDADAVADADIDVDADADIDADTDVDGDADGDGDTDGDGDGDGGMDADDAGPCLSGDSTGIQGAPCTCPEDCSADASLCLWGADGERYCAITGCADWSSPPCPEGAECVRVDLDEVGSYCRQCLGGARGRGELCSCDDDCAAVEVGGSTRSQVCVEGRCAIGPCGTWQPCPSGFVCEEAPGEDYCAECTLPDGSVAIDGACSCDDECADTMECVDRVCALVDCVLGSSTCPAGYDCRAILDGGTRCLPASSTCRGDGAGALGDSCACDGDCSAYAPICLDAHWGEHDLSGCTVRPCAILSGDPCPVAEGETPFSCCMLLGVIDRPTCLPSWEATLFGLGAFCNP